MANYHTVFLRSYLSLLRKISWRIPISRSLWVNFSVLLDPGMTRLPVSVRGRGGVHGTLSSIVSWERRRAISNVCLSIISSRFAASPKSLILLTFTVKSLNHWINSSFITANSITQSSVITLVLHLSLSHPDQSRSNVWDVLPRPSEPSSSFSPFWSNFLRRHAVLPKR